LTLKLTIIKQFNLFYVAHISLLVISLRQTLLVSLDRVGWVWLSERDFHQAFAEAIILGCSDFGRNPEVIARERRTDPEDGAESQWFDNPKFQHYANQQESMKAMNTDAAVVVSMKTKLLAATTEEEVYEILKGKD
jgi:hybrid polyketide synthase / nonribosomal peptide synthetase ACE1